MRVAARKDCWKFMRNTVRFDFQLVFFKGSLEKQELKNRLILIS